MTPIDYSAPRSRNGVLAWIDGHGLIVGGVLILAATIPWLTAGRKSPAVRASVPDEAVVDGLEAEKQAAERERSLQEQLAATQKRVSELTAELVRMRSMLPETPAKAPPTQAVGTTQPVPSPQPHPDAVIWEKNGHGYKVFRERLSWPKAKQRCEELGGHLVTITSIEEQQFVCSVISEAGITVENRKEGIEAWHDKLWIGGTDEDSEGTWCWVDESQWGFTNWLEKQPDGDGNFLNICPHLGGGWNDGREQDYFISGFICEWQQEHSVSHEPTPESDIPVQPSLVNSIGIKLNLIPAGTFTMGEADGSPSDTLHEVTLTKPFYLGVYEVTNAQWKQVMGSVPSQWKDDDLPVEMVSWADAVEFCKKLSALPEERKAGRLYRLPTEAEWEYACRAGTNTRYSFGDDESQLGEYGWFRDNSVSQPQPVGGKKPNAWGLFDMHGNVFEWCSDWYGDYPKGAVTDPQGPPGTSGRVRRGGGWGNSVSTCRTAFRYRIDPSLRIHDLGFRLALSPSGEEPQAKPPEAAVPSPPAAVPDRKEPPEAERSAAAPRKALENSIGIQFTLLPPGTFTMGEANGESDEKPPHQVTLTKPFYLGVYEVTNRQWERVMGSVPSRWKDADRPVERVSWNDANEFCRRLSALPEEKQAGRVYRLPTEAEWEYACRAGTTTRYSFGDDESQLGNYGWFANNSGGQTHPVGQKQPNGWGLYDIHGNVWEWCSDLYGDYGNDAVTDPRGPSGGSRRVYRGGGWTRGARFCRSAYRRGHFPSDRDLGFRLALSPSGEEPQAKPPEAAAGK